MANPYITCPNCDAVYDRQFSACPKCRKENAGNVRVYVPSNRIVTLDHIPGHRIASVVGLVTTVSASSIWTASAKGHQAKDDAVTALQDAAAAQGANAVVGVTASSFGARGGLTSVVGGDAVGVLFVGTAVVVEPIEPTRAP